jgi:putative ABC transport system permease protein
MFKNHWKTAWRNLRRNKVFSFINIIGLSIGISASLVIYLLVAYDLGFDRSQPEGQRIYRVICDITFAGSTFKTPGVPSPMPKAVRKELAGVDLVAAIRTADEAKVTIPRSGQSEPLAARMDWRF